MGKREEGREGGLERRRKGWGEGLEGGREWAGGEGEKGKVKMIVLEKKGGGEGKKGKEEE